MSKPDFSHLSLQVRAQKAQHVRESRPFLSTLPPKDKNCTAFHKYMESKGYQLGDVPGQRNTHSLMDVLDKFDSCRLSKGMLLRAKPKQPSTRSHVFQQSGLVAVLPTSMSALQALYEYGKNWKSWGTCIVCEAAHAQLIAAHSTWSVKRWVCPHELRQFQYMPLRQLVAFCLFSRLISRPTSRLVVKCMADMACAVITSA